MTVLMDRGVEVDFNGPNRITLAVPEIALLDMIMSMLCEMGFQFTQPYQTLDNKWAVFGRRKHERANRD